MITIKTSEDKKGAYLNIEEGTPELTMLFGTELLIEALMEVAGVAFEDVMHDLKVIYYRDKELKENGTGHEGI